MSINLSLNKNDGRTDDFTVNLQPNITNVENYYVALTNLAMWYSFYNISSRLGNNTMVYNDGTTDYNVTFPDGVYNVEDIDGYLKRVMKENNTYSGSTPAVYYIEIKADYATGRVLLEISNSYSVTFDSKLNDLLGFIGTSYSSNTTGEELANINNGVNQIHIHTDIVNSNYSFNNSQGSDIIYSFVPDSLPYTSISREPINPIYLPVADTNGKISNVRLYITDQLGRRLNLNSEPVSVNLHLKKIM